MPKSRPPRRSQKPAADLVEPPPGQAEVERAIEAVLERLMPRPAARPRDAEAPARRSGRSLARLPGSDG